MKKTISTICAAMLMMAAVHANDILTLQNGTLLQGKILSSSGTAVVFLPDGEVYSMVLDRADIAAIRSSEEAIPEEEQSSEYNKNNLIGLNYLELGILLNLHLSYERILADGYLGLGLNYAMALDPVENRDSYIHNLNYYYKNRYSFDINIYPTGQHRVSYYIGPSIIYGTFSYDDQDTATAGLEDRTYSSFMLNNGFNFQVTPNFTMGLRVGIGLVRELDESGEYRGLNSSIPLVGFNVAIRL